MSTIGGQLNEARFALIFEGTDLDFSAIAKEIGLAPTRTHHKGDIINRLPEIKADTDEWAYSIALSNALGYDADLDQLLRYLVARKPQLLALTATTRILLRLYVQSDYAHMNYSLSHDTLSLLTALSLPLEISSLSWGETGM